MRLRALGRSGGRPELCSESANGPSSSSSDHSSSKSSSRCENGVEMTRMDKKMTHGAEGHLR